MLRWFRDRPCLSVAGLVLLVAVVVFRDFLFGDRLFVFTGIGSDTFVQYWPVDRHLSEFVRSGRFPAWSQGIGLGTAVFLSEPLLNPGLAVLYALPPWAYLPGLAVKAVFESLAAALGWWLFLRSAGVRGRAGLLFPLLFAFTGYLTLWGQHRGFGIVFMAVPLVLWTHELMLQRGKRWPLIAALTWFLSVDVYLFWMFSLFFAPFSLLRWATLGPLTWPAFRRWLARFALCCAAAAALSAWAALPMVLRLADSPRTVLGGVTPQGVNAFFPIPLYLAAILRLFGNNVLGTDIDYRGPLNYYELPALYAGMLPLLLLPQVFLLAGRRERRLLALGGVFVVASIASPAAALAFNGFSAVTHRHGFIAIVFMLYAAARAFSLLESGGRVHRGGLAATLACLLLPLAGVLTAAGLAEFGRLPPAAERPLLETMRAVMPLATIDDMRLVLRHTVLPTMTLELLKAAAFLVAYAAVLYGYGPRRARLLGGVLVLLAVAEVAVMTWPTHNRSVTLDKAHGTRAAGYDDDSSRAVRRLRAADPSLYRVQKTYNSVFLNDNLIQGYYGTQSYLSLQERSLIEFYRSLRIPLHRFHPNYVPGVGGRVMVSTLLGVKYTLSRGDPLTWPGYEPFDRVGEATVYRNNDAVPLGFAYRRRIAGKDFRTMPDVLRHLALLRAFVPTPDGTDAAAGTNLPAWTPGPRETEAARCLYDLKQGRRVDASGGRLEWTGPASVTFRPDGGRARLVFPLEGDPDGGVAVSFDLLSRFDARLGLRLCPAGEETREERGQPLAVYRGQAHYDSDLFSSANRGVFCIELPSAPCPFVISNLLVHRFPALPYAEAAAECRRETLAVDSFGGDRLSGRITVDGDAVLGLSVPYNRGWRVWRNGVRVPVGKINFGFMGIPLTRGANRIEMRFVPPGLRLGCAATLATALGIAAWSCGRRVRRRMVTAAPSPSRPPDGPRQA